MADEATSKAAEDLAEFVPPWLEKYLQNLNSGERERFLREYSEGVRELLKQLEASPMNQIPDGKERGKFSARIPGTNTFVNLKSTLITAVKYGGPLLLATALAAPLVGLLGITVGAPLTIATVGSAGAALYGAFAKLNPIEMDTYLAVGAAIERNKNRVLENSGASVKQVLESFGIDEQLSEPDSPEAVLKSLVEKKVLSYDASSGVSQYYLAF
jgi:hypothetical protein